MECSNVGDVVYNDAG